MMVGRLSWFIAMILALSASAATARDYGAIAYSKTTGTWAFTNSETSKKRAMDKAMATCATSATDCVVEVWFYHTCGAIAAGSNAVVEIGVSTEPEIAERNAVKACSKTGVECKSVYKTKLEM